MQSLFVKSVLKVSAVPNAELKALKQFIANQLTMLQLLNPASI